MITDVTGVLLAGGKSRRMGEDKRSLHVGARTLFECSLSVLHSVFTDVLVVIAQDSPALEAGVPVYRDLVPDCGSIGGLYTGLKRATTPYIFSVACDMPFLNPRAIDYFVGLKCGADIVMAKLHNGFHPMHALYSQRCLPIIEEMIKERNLKIQTIVAHPALTVRLLNKTDLQSIDPEGRSFLNVNTPADLEAARSLAARRKDSSPS